MISVLPGDARHYAKAVHYLVADLSQKRTEYRILPQDWLVDDCSSLRRLLCFYYIKHGRGNLLGKVNNSKSIALRDILFRSALYFALRDASAAPLAAIGNLELNGHQRRLVWGASALLASVQGSNLRALRLAVLSGAVPAAAGVSSTAVSANYRERRAESLMKFQSISFFAGDSTVVKLF